MPALPRQVHPPAVAALPPTSLAEGPSHRRGCAAAANPSRQAPPPPAAPTTRGRPHSAPHSRQRSGTPGGSLPGGAAGRRQPGPHPRQAPGGSAGRAATASLRSSTFQRLPARPAARHRVQASAVKARAGAGRGAGDRVLVPRRQSRTRGAAEPPPLLPTARAEEEKLPARFLSDARPPPPVAQVPEPPAGGAARPGAVPGGAPRRS